jgi:hypothetical protein
MVGRSGDSMVVTVDGGEVTVPVGPMPPTDSGDEPGPDGDGTRWFLELADVESGLNPGVVYDVHLMPAGGSPTEDSRVGLVSFFGIELAEEADHAMAYTFDVTDAMAQMARRGPVAEVEVALAPQADDPPETTDQVESGSDTAGAPPTVRVGTVALHVGT